MFDDFNQILDDSNPKFVSDSLKEFMLAVFASKDFTNTVDTMTQPEKPRRRRSVKIPVSLPPPPVIQDSSSEEELIFDLNWAFDLVLPLLQAGEVNEYIGELLVESAHSLLSIEPLMMDLNFSDDIKTIIVGDIHGQFLDLIQIFEKFGRPGPNLRYIFNGDIVDRGPRSVACWLFLCTLKTAAPNYLFITRGNHETRTVGVLNSSFAHECFNLYSQSFYLLCQKVFDELPIAYTLNNSIFITHGGLPKNLCLKKLRKMSKNNFNPTFDQETIMALLWNDPIDLNGYNRNNRGSNVFSFGPDITEKFLSKHNLSLLIRSHEFKFFGHQYTHNSKCLTVFSSPDYQKLGNSGAVAIVSSDGAVRIEQF